MSVTNRATRVGRVASNKMEKTVVVEVEVVKRHPIYHRNIRHTSRLKAHDETNSCHIGDMVKVEVTRPLSREKRWRILEIIEHAQALSPVE
jgi:small subunit ribosomal protein S17